MIKRRDEMRFLHMGCGESLRSSGLAASCGVRRKQELPGKGKREGVWLCKGGNRHEEQR